MCTPRSVGQPVAIPSSLTAAVQSEAAAAAMRATGRRRKKKNASGSYWPPGWGVTYALINDLQGVLLNNTQRRRKTYIVRRFGSRLGFPLLSSHLNRQIYSAHVLKNIKKI